MPFVQSEHDDGGKMLIAIELKCFTFSLFFLYSQRPVLLNCSPLPREDFSAPTVDMVGVHLGKRPRCYRSSVGLYSAGDGVCGRSPQFRVL